MGSGPERKGKDFWEKCVAELNRNIGEQRTTESVRNKWKRLWDEYRDARALIDRSGEAALPADRRPKYWRAGTCNHVSEKVDVRPPSLRRGIPCFDQKLHLLAVTIGQGQLSRAQKNFHQGGKTPQLDRLALNMPLSPKILGILHDAEATQHQEVGEAGRMETPCASPCARKGCRDG